RPRWSAGSPPRTTRTAAGRTGEASRPLRRRASQPASQKAVQYRPGARLSSPSAPSYPLGAVFLGDLVVEERRRVRRRHEAPVDLGVDAGILEHLAVRHLDLERAALLVVADRAQARGIDPLSFHQAFSTAMRSPARTCASTRASPCSVPMTLQRLASLGRSSVEIGVRP